jgi:hypothetical protein
MACPSSRLPAVRGAGLAAYEAKDYKRAMAVWLPLAEAGHAEAQFRVGRLHGEGESIAKDETVAATWYRKAAEQGHALGQVALGDCLWHGRGVAMSSPEASRPNFVEYRHAAPLDQYRRLMFTISLAPLATGMLISKVGVRLDDMLRTFTVVPSGSVNS